MGAAITGVALPELPGTAAGLSGEPALVFAAMRSAAAQRWDEVAALDNPLAQAGWTARLVGQRGG